MLTALASAALSTAAPAEHHQTCRDVMEPIGTCAHKKRYNKLDCNDASNRRRCAKSCGTCTRLMVPTQVGLLMDGVLPIPDNATTVMLEIGSSDRNTMDKEMLPRMPQAFLVTAEPLLEKYARALTRRRPSVTVQDSLEPLGQHHDRGIVLPVAVAPVAGNGELRDLNVGGNSGCASLLKPNRMRHRGGSAFGVWCDATGESANSAVDSRSGARSVYTVPLRQLLQWIGRPVDFVKIDAQGMDMEIIRSGGLLLKSVRRVLLEVISDDCKPVYEGQPRCSEVVRSMAALGFAPLTPLPCSPPMGRSKVNHYCELEYVFINQAAGVTAESTPSEWFEYHQGHLNWCSGSYDIIKEGHPYFTQGVHAPSPLLALARGMSGDRHTIRAAIHHEPELRNLFPTPWFYKREWASTRPGFSGQSHPRGQPYLCPNTCFINRTNSNRTHLFGHVQETLRGKRLFCPFN